jgi:hypothetical protein
MVKLQSFQTWTHQNRSHKPSNMVNHHQFLGLKTNASQAQVRSAYKALALEHHPDKVEEANREKATSYFQQLHDAYVDCLMHAQSQPTVEDADDNTGGDGLDWRGWFPDSIGRFGVSWWDDLDGSEPLPVQQWAKVCAKAERNARISKTEKERMILNMEYVAAHSTFEKWHRVHIEAYDEEDALQQRLKDMNVRDRKVAQGALDAKRADSNYIHNDNWRDYLDSEDIFNNWEDGDTSHLLVPQDTWRDKNYNTASEKVSAYKQLANHKVQIAALEQRSADGGPPLYLSHKSNKEINRAKQARLATLNKLENKVKALEKAEKERAIKKALNKCVPVKNTPSAVNLQIFQDEPLAYERFKAVESVPDS